MNQIDDLESDFQKIMETFVSLVESTQKQDSESEISSLVQNMNELFQTIDNKSNELSFLNENLQQIQQENLSLETTLNQSIRERSRLDERIDKIKSSFIDS